MTLNERIKISRDARDKAQRQFDAEPSPTTSIELAYENGYLAALLDTKKDMILELTK